MKGKHSRSHHKHRKHHMVKGHLKVGKRTRVVWVSKHQTGKTHLRADRKRKALHPGKRVTGWGTMYYETRANRSDKNYRKRL